MTNATFTKIPPFVRYIHSVCVPAEILQGWVCGYDCRLFYGIHGKSKVELEDRVFMLERGSLLLLPPGTKYRLDTGEGNAQSQMIGINFDYFNDHSDKTVPIPPESPEFFQPEKVLGNIHFSDVAYLNTPQVIENIQSVESDLLEMEREFTEQITFFSSFLSAKMYQVLVAIVRRLTQFNEHDDNTQRETIDEIIRYIHSHYNCPLKNSVIGEVFNYHPNYINNLITKYTGRSLHQYLIDIRINKAIGLLETTDEKIHEIALEVGFSDAAHFSRTFRKFTGRSPSDYRRV